MGAAGSGVVGQDRPAAAAPCRDAGRVSGKAGVRERYDAKLKARLTLAFLQAKDGVAKLAAEHDVPPEVSRRWRRAVLLPLERQAEGKPTPIGKMRKELRHVKCSHARSAVQEYRPLLLNNMLELGNENHRSSGGTVAVFSNYSCKAHGYYCTLQCQVCGI